MTRYDTGVTNGWFDDYTTSKYLSDTLMNDDGEDGEGIYFTQIDDTTLYTISTDGGNINMYDLTAGSETYQQLVTIPINVGFPNRGCLASSVSLSSLYVAGGFNSGSIANLQILNLSDMQWSDGPSMSYGRVAHGCVVVNDRLWAIGSVEEVEAINITNISSQSWSDMFSLPTRLSSFGLTVLDDIIYIIGGVDENSNYEEVDTMYLIDTAAGNYDLYEDSLPMELQGMAVIVVDRTIYGFGGYSSTSAEWWQDTLVTYDVLSGVR